MQVEFQGEKVIISKEDFFKYFGKEAVQQVEIKASKESDLTQQVTESLAQFGIPRHIKGFDYLREAVILSVNDKSYINYITKRLYPELAKGNDDMPSRVERAIRHAIEVGWMNGNLERINSVFGNSVSLSKGKPTNSEFIATVADNIRLARQ